jgi:hypothetical protein
MADANLRTIVRSPIRLAAAAFVLFPHAKKLLFRARSGGRMRKVGADGRKQVSKRSRRRPFARDPAAFPHAQGSISRLAAARIHAAGISLGPLLQSAGLPAAEIADRDALLERPGPDCVPRTRRGRVAGRIDRVQFGPRIRASREWSALLHSPSSETLSDGLRKVARYSSIVHEGIRLSLHLGTATHCCK